MDSLNIKQLEAVLSSEGWLTHMERLYLYQCAYAAPSGGTIVNIGVEKGASIHCLLAGRRQENITVFGYDVDMSNFIGNKEAPGLTLIEGDSGEAAKSFGEAAIVKAVDLLFIDGDHSYRGVRRDTLWATHVRRGGLVIFHDCYAWPPDPPRTIHHNCPGVNKAVEATVVRDPAWVELAHVDSMRVFQRV